MVFKINPSPAIPALPRVEDKSKIDVRYSLISPYANAHIYWDHKSSELRYDIEEPILDDNEKETLKKLEAAMLELININVLVEKTKEKMMDYVDKTTRLLMNELNIKLPEDSYVKISYYLYRNFIGFNEIEPFLKDYFIEDIECNGTGTPVYIVHRIYRNIKTNLEYSEMGKLSNFVEKLAQRSGKYISYSEPLLDSTLPDGSRVNATYTEDITSKGPTFTIRKFTKVPWTPTQLISLNTLSPEMLAYFWILIQYKSNIFISGGTASGKTTLLNALAFFIPPEARVVSIEDTRELNLPRENWLPAVARVSVGTGKVGEVDLFDLLRNSFRQNPDYVIVGEVRGKEAFVLFQGMASGHPSLSTMHAESVDSMMKRLETPPIELSPTLVNTLDCVAIMTHAIVKKKDTRRLREVVEIVDVKKEGPALINTPYVWNPYDDIFYYKRDSKVFEKIALKFGLSSEKLQTEFILRAKLLYTLYKKKIFGFDQMQQIISEYYKNPTKVLSRYGISV
ncbi:secretion system protein E [Candidatus Parvarchaeota archaeon]|nr:MAG: secretion system protein E [Candidatus Parvarchaeota archaeon]HIG52266.1 secretion system protein E [Candidatus Pacearchaeota archaeon]